MNYRVTQITWIISCILLTVLFVIAPLAGLAVLLIGIFLYPKYRVYQRLQKSRARLQQTAQQSPKKLPLWAVLIFVGMLIGIPTAAFLLLRFVFRKAFSEISQIKGVGAIPNWVWFIIVLLGILWLVWYYRRFILNKMSGIPQQIQSIKRSLDWRWIWIPTVILMLFVLYRYVWPSWQLSQTPVTTDMSNRGYTQPDPLAGSPDLNMNGENHMRKGEFFQFAINWDEPAISFDPATSDTTVLYFQKKEDPTREWRLFLWKNCRGDKEYRFSPRAPIVDALIGTVYIKSENRSGIVVVTRK